jgi:D-glycero-D-manno-heptose 1,7-bisphosphate phosphatase
VRRRFAILDRDGTVIVDRHYLADPAGVELLPNALSGLQRLSSLGLGLAIVSNQSGLARGYFDRAAVDAVNTRMKELLAAGGVQLDGIYYCPHIDADDCTCRKPRPGMMLQAVAELDFDPAQAFVLGDKACDVDLGRAFGATSFMVRTGYGAQARAEDADRASYVVADLAEAADVIARLVREIQH